MKIQDATACRALELLIASTESMLIPRTQRWDGLRVRDKAVHKNTDIRDLLDEEANILFATRYARNPSFAREADDVWMYLVHCTIEKGYSFARIDW